MIGLKRIAFSTFLITSVCFLPACKDDNSPQALRYEILKALDSGDYDKVIDRLENDKAYQKAFSQEELKINLAAAYIGKAGFDAATVINDILNTDNDGDTFKLFAQAISKKAKGQNLILLDKALSNYDEIIGTSNCENTENLSDLQKDACFLKGLVETAKGTSSLVLVLSNNQQGLEDVIEKWIEGVSPCSQDDVNSTYVFDEVEATACAIEYANNNSCSIPDSNVSVSNITFDNGMSYTLLKIDINPSPLCTTPLNTNTYYKLIKDNDLVITDGFCKTDFSPCNTPDGITCFPCPVVSNGENFTVEDTIIETINNGADSIISVLPENQQSDLKENIHEFKVEICSASPSDCLCDGTPCLSIIDVENASELEITEEALANYLKNQ